MLGLDPTLPAQVHDLFPDRRLGRRHHDHHRPAAGRAAAGHRRRVRQVLRAQARRLRRLHADDRDPAAGARRACSAEGRRNERGARLARCGDARWRWWEIALWRRWPSVAGSSPASHALLVNEIAIFALFAVSLDLILGYAGIVSLGHAAFFGFGAYAAALFAKHVMPDPLVGLAVAIGGADAARRAVAACWCCAAPT